MEVIFDSGPRRQIGGGVVLVLIGLALGAAIGVWAVKRGSATWPAYVGWALGACCLVWGVRQMRNVSRIWVDKQALNVSYASGHLLSIQRTDIEEVEYVEPFDVHRVPHLHVKYRKGFAPESGKIIISARRFGLSDEELKKVQDCLSTASNPAR